MRETLTIVLLAAAAAAQDPVATPKPGGNPAAPAGEAATSTGNGGNSGGNSGGNQDGLLLLDATAACRIELDGNPADTIPAGVKAIALSPGPHALVATADNGSIVNERFDIPPGGQQALVLEFAEASGGARSAFRRSVRDGLEYALIPAGEFPMGCTPGDLDCDADENPSHRASIAKQFYLGRTEVTEEAFARFCREPGAACPAARPAEDGTMPKTGVSWNQADAFCRWSGGRLPTEAEWERAARGGVEFRYPSGNTLDHESANYSGSNGRDKWDGPAPVARFPANAFGLYDMAGNLWEWCSDWYAAEYSGVSPQADPRGPPQGTERVLRGGSWNSSVLRLRVSARFSADPAATLPNAGFRCARDTAP